MAQSMELADKISGKKRHLSGRLSSILLHNSPSVAVKTFKSPDKNSSFLLSQLMSSPTTPSSSRKTPRKSSSTTPAKSITESPSMNTRSKSPAVALGFARPKALFQESPLKHGPDSAKKSQRQIGSGKKSQSFGFSSAVPSSPVVVDTPKKVISPVIQSPSQNTRSKVTCTPTRQSVRAALFVKSPEAKSCKQIVCTSFEHGSLNSEGAQKSSRQLVRRKSIVVSDNAIIQDPEKEQVPTSSGKFVVEGCSNVSKAAGQQSEIKLQWDGKSNEVCGISFSSEQVRTLKTQASKAGVSKTPSPLTKKKKRKLSTPSPSEKQIRKTPSSLDKWPRKKRGSDLSSPKSVVYSKGTDSGSKSLKSLFKKVDEKEENMEVENETIFSDLSQDVKSSQESTSSILPRKRSLHLSPENISTIFSPSKRRRILDNQHIDENSEVNTLLCRGQGKSSMAKLQGKENPRLSYCLHSRILSRKASEASGASEGFPTGSQSSWNVNSQQSLGSLSQTSWGTDDYLSSTNDDVFVNLSQNKLEEEEMDARSDSPVFGSSRKKKLEMKPDNTDGSVSKDSLSKMESVVEKASSSGTKYSPNVSAKSLMHLMNSPLLKSPVSRKGAQSLTSPKLDKDSLNVRRKKMSDKSSRRSLNLHK